MVDLELKNMYRLDLPEIADYALYN